MFEYYKAQEVLRRCWQIGDRVKEMSGESFAESRKGLAFLSLSCRVDGVYCRIGNRAVACSDCSLEFGSERRLQMWQV